MTNEIQLRFKYSLILHLTGKKHKLNENKHIYGYPYQKQKQKQKNCANVYTFLVKYYCELATFQNQNQNLLSLFDACLSV